MPHPAVICRSNVAGDIWSRLVSRHHETVLSQHRVVQKHPASQLPRRSTEVSPPTPRFRAPRKRDSPVGIWVCRSVPIKCRRRHIFFEHHKVVAKRDQTANPKCSPGNISVLDTRSCPQIRRLNEEDARMGYAGATLLSIIPTQSEATDPNRAGPIWVSARADQTANLRRRRLAGT